MLTYDFTANDLALTRFAISPMWEVVAGLRMLRDPERAGPHLPWLKEALPIAHEMRKELALPLALLPGKGYIPDFMTPPPESPVESFADELKTVSRTNTATMEHDVRKLARGRRMNARERAFLDDPRAGLRAMVDTLGAWWERALEPHWPRVRSVLDADLAYRARRLTEGGPAMLFSDLGQDTAWQGDHLIVDIRHDARLGLSGRGLLIVPSAFGWLCVSSMAADEWQPTIFYPARGLELLWEPGAVSSDALAGVLGRSRADLLANLDAPRSTSDLARRLSLSPGGVSQHLGALREAGLVSATRQGREVLYLRTALAEGLQAGAETGGTAELA